MRRITVFRKLLTNKRILGDLKREK